MSVERDEASSKSWLSRGLDQLKCRCRVRHPSLMSDESRPSNAPPARRGPAAGHRHRGRPGRRGQEPAHRQPRRLSGSARAQRRHRRRRSGRGRPPHDARSRSDAAPQASRRQRGRVREAEELGGDARPQIAADPHVHPGARPHAPRLRSDGRAPALRKKSALARQRQRAARGLLAARSRRRHSQSISRSFHGRRRRRVRHPPRAARHRIHLPLPARAVRPPAAPIARQRALQASPGRACAQRSPPSSDPRGSGGGARAVRPRRRRSQQRRRSAAFARGSS